MLNTCNPKYLIVVAMVLLVSATYFFLIGGPIKSTDNWTNGEGCIKPQGHIKNLAGEIFPNELASGVCGKESFTNCNYMKCECANKLPPEIGEKSGLLLPQISAELFATVAESYIYSIKLIVLNSFYNPQPYHIDGSLWPKDVNSMTMVGSSRLDNVWRLVEDVIARDIPGDFIEAGAWRGGTCAFVSAIFKAYGQHKRSVFCSDSFKGIPNTTKEENNNRPITNQDATAHTIGILNDNSLQKVKENFERLKLSAEFIEGYFKPALYDADASGKFAAGFAVIRLDGDTYFSTWQAINVLYPHLYSGGYLIIDDYLDWEGCKQAIIDYRTAHNITSPILPVAYPTGTQIRGVWWKKE